jgi:multidrug resistance efflux pump
MVKWLRRRIGIVLGVLVLLAAGTAWAVWRRTRPPDLLFSGEVQAHLVHVGSLIGGRVLEVPASEGAAIEAGQPLVVLEPDLIDAQVAEQESRVAAVRASLARTAKGPRHEEVVRARVLWQNAAREYERRRGLFRAGAISREELDIAETQAEAARQSYLEGVRGGRREDVTAARATLVQEEARLAYLRRQRQETVVRAPGSGVVEVLDIRPGDLVGPNAPVAALLDTGDLWVRVYVPEPSLGLVHLGQAAEIRVDSFPGRSFPGRVVEITQQAQYTPRNVQTREQRNDLVFGVKVAPQGQPPLRPGMAATVRLKSEPEE